MATIYHTAFNFWFPFFREALQPLPFSKAVHKKETSHGNGLWYSTAGTLCNDVHNGISHTILHCNVSESMIHESIIFVCTKSNVTQHWCLQPPFNNHSTRLLVTLAAKVLCYYGPQQKLLVRISRESVTQHQNDCI